MSKFELRARAYETGGVTFAESEVATQLVPSVYERLGKEQGMEELSTKFYDRVFADPDAWFTSIFASSTKGEAIDNQWRFFVQTFGGPDLYRQKGKGRFVRLAGRHANYPIGHRAADRWVSHMEAALDEHSRLQCQPSSSSREKEASPETPPTSDSDSENEASASSDNVDSRPGERAQADAVHSQIDRDAFVEETKGALRAYFRYTAHYIVAASVYMRDDQLSGGTRIDEGRVW